MRKYYQASRAAVHQGRVKAQVIRAQERQEMRSSWYEQDMRAAGLERHIGQILPGGARERRMAASRGMGGRSENGRAWAGIGVTF